MNSGRGITIRINRREAIRIIGEAMRQKTKNFELEKKRFPAVFAWQRALAARYYTRKTMRIRAAKTPAELHELLNENTIDYTIKKDWAQSPPELNLCREKQLLLMLQNDVREIVPINSNHELWAILQGKCEPIHG